MLGYIGSAVLGLAVLIIGIVLIVRRKKALGITLTVLGALAFVAGSFLAVCTFILVDFIHDQPVKEPPVTESVTTETETTGPEMTGETSEEYTEPEEDDEILGADWKTWRSYSDEYVINDDLTVCLSLFDDITGYAVYDSSDGNRIASLINDTEADIDPWNTVSEDIDGDGVNELGIALTSGETLWYKYIEGEMWNENNVNGCFERTDK